MKLILISVSYFIAFLIFFASSVKSQNRDQVWVLGFIPSQDYPNGSITFLQGFPDTSILLLSSLPIAQTKANICDTNGNLLFYTNGIWIANSLHDTMLNGFGITTGFGADLWQESGTLILQAALILPRPLHTNEFYVFAVNADIPIIMRPLKLVYSKVDMALDNGLGGVTDKNISIINDTLTNGRITACKHADGKSWWLFVHETRTKTYYSWLITADSIYGPNSQNIGSKYGTGFTDIAGQSCFSRDGKKFATFGNNYKLDVMDFDRCTGLLSNSKTWVFNQDSSSGIMGCSFSPNGKFIYANSQTRLWQIDLDSLTQNAVDTIGYYDGFLDPFWTFFGPSLLAPDGKIYFGEWNGNLSMHVINEPDLKGTACDFKQHSFLLPVYNGTLPNLVNYDLAPLKIYEADAGSDKYIYGIDTIQIGTVSIDSLVYQWKPANTLSDSTIAQPLAFPLTTTTYYLTIIDTTDTACCNQRIDSVVVHVDEYPTAVNETSFGFNLYPNPAQDFLFIKLNEASGHIQYQITNAIGQLEFKRSAFSSSNFSININKLIPGIYFLQVQTENGIMVKKFLKK